MKILALGLLILVLAAVALFSESTTAAQSTQSGHRIVVVDARGVHGHDILVVRDEDTRREYLIACGGDQAACSIATLR